MARLRWVTVGVVASIVVASAAVVAHAVGPRGAGLTIDSTSYLLAADSYSRDISEVGPVLNGVFPPGYPAAIALAHLVVDDLGRAAVAVNVVALVVVLALIAHGVWSSGRDDESDLLRRSLATIATVATVAFSTQVLRWSSAAMSEMFSLLFVFLALAIAARGGSERSTLRWLAVGIVAGMAALVRLVALGSVLGLAAGVFLLTGPVLRRRLWSAGVVTASGVITSIVGVPLLQSSNDSKRTIAWHPITRAEIEEGLETIAAYTLPSSAGDALGRILAVVVIGGFVLFVAQVARRVSATDRSVPATCLLATSVAVAHVATVLGSMFVLDDLTPLDPRILLPVVPLVALAVGSAVAAKPPVVPAKLALALGLLVLAGQVGRVVEWHDEMRTSGMGYAHTLFDGSETLAVVRDLPAEAEVWTNDVSLLYLRADRRAAQLPSDTDNYSGRAIEDYEEALQALGDRLDAGAVVVYADYFDFTTLPDVDELRRTIGPLDVDTLSDGAIVRRSTDRSS